MTQEKINVAELLKNCPKGLELDCTMYDNCTFDGIDDVGYTEILVKIPNGRIRLTKEGCFVHQDKYAKCVIFPKGKTTWEGFVPPFEFKDGDILATKLGSIFVLKETSEEEYYYSCYIALNNVSRILKNYTQFCAKKDCRFATEEEKERLFKAIKENGYKWNTETKTLEKLPRFKVGDKIEKCGYRFTIAKVKDDYYLTKCGNKIPIGNQDDFRLVPDKFDISTLKPFDKVLTRDNGSQKWDANLFSFYDNESGDYCFQLVGIVCARYCIPFVGNEHLLGTTNACDEFYKTWTNEEELLN